MEREQEVKNKEEKVNLKKGIKKVKGAQGVINQTQSALVRGREDLLSCVQCADTHESMDATFDEWVATEEESK